MDCIAHGVTKGWTQLTFTFTVHSYVFWWAIRELQNFTSLLKTFLWTQALQMQK